jgi:hypothetical protein
VGEWNPTTHKLGASSTKGLEWIAYALYCPPLGYIFLEFEIETIS